MTAEELKNLLSTYNIQFREAGENVGRDNININCPFCAGADPSFHMGLSTVGKGYACWRDPAHRGKNLNRVFKILGLPIVSTDYFFAPNVFDDIAGGTFFNKTAVSKPYIKNITKLPEHFLPIGDRLETKNHRNYLATRGFDNPRLVCGTYDLLFSREPKWADRIVLPIYINDEVTWTGRTILPGVVPRYRSAAGGEARNIKDCLFNYNELVHTSGAALVIVEGPFDALKLDYYGAPSVRATCLFGMVASETQLALLNNMLGNFDSIYIALDRGEVAGAVKLMKQLPFCQILQLPTKDFGEMLSDNIQSYIETAILN